MVIRNVELTEEQNETLERLAASQGRAVSELIRAGVDVVLGGERSSQHLTQVKGAPERAPRLSEKESKLLLAINRSLPEPRAGRYQELVSRRRAGTLNPLEQQELLDLTDEMEQLQAERIEHLIELAQLRGRPLGVLMEELGIRPSPSE